MPYRIVVFRYQFGVHFRRFSLMLEISVFLPEILLCGYTAQGTKMVYDTGSSSMDYSNRMTGLTSTLAFPAKVVVRYPPPFIEEEGQLQLPNTAGDFRAALWLYFP